MIKKIIHGSNRTADEARNRFYRGLRQVVERDAARQQFNIAGALTPTGQKLRRPLAPKYAKHKQHKGLTPRRDLLYTGALRASKIEIRSIRGGYLYQLADPAQRLKLRFLKKKKARIWGIPKKILPQLHRAISKTAREARYAPPGYRVLRADE